MQKSDYVFTIGYKGDTGVVDKKLRSRYGKLSTIELYNEGLYKQAALSAIYEKSRGNTEDLKDLLEQFKNGDNLDEAQLLRLYGIPNTIKFEEHS